MKSMLNKLVKKKLLDLGFSNHYSLIYADYIVDDLEKKGIPLKKKIWALKHGFRLKTISFCNLTDTNFKDYISDIDYYSLHPINGFFSHWIDDKITFRYILEPYSNYLPEYYYHLYNDEILKLIDCPEYLGNNIKSIITLLKEKRVLAAKLLNSVGGQGFFKLEFNNLFYVNNVALSEDELIQKIKTWGIENPGGYLITEYLFPCEELSKIWNKSGNALRITVIREKNKSAEIVFSFIRFGTSKTGTTDSTIRGGVTCSVNIDNGRYENATVIENDEIKDCKYHPDTKVLVEGVIPNWQTIKEKILEISNFIPQVIYMGYDVIVTQEGFKIIEINSHQGISFFQTNKPIMKDDNTREFFAHQLKQKKQIQQRKKGTIIVDKFIIFLKRTKHELYKMFNP